MPKRGVSLCVLSVDFEADFQMLSFALERPLACITLGRANLDLYPPQGHRLSQARSYQAFVGGSPANIAAGLVRRSLRAGIITKLADDGVGHFVQNYLHDFGIDTSQVLFECSGSRTSLVLAERCRKADSVFYRQQPSDLLLQPEDISLEYIASAKVLFISGAALSQEPCRSAVQTAIDGAKRAGTVVAMDMDYRPYGWDSQEQVEEVLQRIASQCELLIGTSEEFCLASGMNVPDDPEDTPKDDSKFLQIFSNAQLLVVKRGQQGANAYHRDKVVTKIIKGALLPAALKKPWGAGDAFASSLLASLLLSKSLEQAMQDAAAAASLNISGDSCTEAMPSSAEIEDFLHRYHNGLLPSEWID